MIFCFFIETASSSKYELKSRPAGLNGKWQREIGEGRKRIILGCGAGSNNPREIRHDRMAASFGDSFSRRTCLVTVAPFPSSSFFPPRAISALSTRRYSFSFPRVAHVAVRYGADGKLICPCQSGGTFDRTFARFGFFAGTIEGESASRRATRSFQGKIRFSPWNPLEFRRCWPTRSSKKEYSRSIPRI